MSFQNFWFYINITCVIVLHDPLEKKLMFVVSFTVALHCKSGFFWKWHTPNVQKRLRHLKKMKKKKSVFVCFLHFLELEGEWAFDELS